MKNKILIVTGDGGESYEVLYASHRLREAGYTPAIAAPSKRRLHLVMHDFEPGWDTYIERAGYGAEADLSFDDVTVDQFDAVMVLGGRAPEYLRNDKRVIAIVREFHDRGKWVFAICHGIQILISAGLANGTCMTAYEHLRFEIESNGGTYSTNQAVQDGGIVTAQTWMSHPVFYREVFACLGAPALAARG